MTDCKLCPMLNSAGVCDAALRRPERIRICPHRRILLALIRRGMKRPRDG